MNLKDKNVCGFCVFYDTDFKIAKFGYYKILLESEQRNE